MDWDEGKLFWQDTAIILDRSPYLCGIVTDMRKYEPWINNILHISDDKIGRIIDSTPIEWGVPNSYLDTLKHFVNSTQQMFMPLFRNYMEFENYAG